MSFDEAKRIAVLFGGRSAEHDVSLRSAEFVNDALISAGFETVLIGFDRDGIWRLAPEISRPKIDWPQVAILPGSGGKITCISDRIQDQISIDVVFPVLHGPFGEDGSVQGLLKQANVAYVGPGILASAAAMDKDACKQFLRASGVPVVPSVCFAQDNAPSFPEVSNELGLPIFVKPANMGSSVGVSKVHDEAEYQAALSSAFRFDTKVLAESDADGQELECAVLSADGQLNASGVAEIISTSNAGFYDYTAKYEAEDGATLQAPAQLPADVTEQVREMALTAAHAVGVEGMARVDFFLKADGKLLVNEINTIPGFTSISMYPVLWDLSGIPAAQLVTQLVQHARERFKREQQLASHHTV